MKGITAAICIILLLSASARADNACQEGFDVATAIMTKRQQNAPMPELVNAINDSSVSDETKQLGKVVATVKEFVVSPWPDVAKYAGDGMSNLHSNRIVPYSFLQRKLAAVAVFRKDRIGSSGALKRALTTLTERGDLQEISRATLAKDYGTSARAFMIANPRVFEL